MNTFSGTELFLFEFSEACFPEFHSVWEAQCTTMSVFALGRFCSLQIQDLKKIQIYEKSKVLHVSVHPWRMSDQRCQAAEAFSFQVTVIQ